MLTMQSLAAQNLPHDIQPEAYNDYSETGWVGGFERDGSERYKYKSNDNFLEIKLWEQFIEDENGEIDKQYSDWVAQVWYNNTEQVDLCDIDGMTATESLENILKKINKPEYVIKARHDWQISYKNIAGSVLAPMWI